MILRFASNRQESIAPLTVSIQIPHALDRPLLHLNCPEFVCMHAHALPKHKLSAIRLQRIAYDSLLELKVHPTPPRNALCCPALVRLCQPPMPRPASPASLHDPSLSLDPLLSRHPSASVLHLYQGPQAGLQQSTTKFVTTSDLLQPSSDIYRSALKTRFRQRPRSRPAGPRNPHSFPTRSSFSCHPQINASMSPKPTSILADATNTVRKGLRRMASGGLTPTERSRARGKENYPPCPHPFSPTFAPLTPNGLPSPFPLPSFSPEHGTQTHQRHRHRSDGPGEEAADVRRKWDSVDGMIIIKVSVPCTDDLWRFKVPLGVSLRSFRRKVEAKVGFLVSFVDTRVSSAYSGGDSGYIEGGVGRRVSTEEGFRRWVEGRVGKDGRNVPLVAIPRPSRVRPSTQNQHQHHGEAAQSTFSPNTPLGTPMLEHSLTSPSFPDTPGMLLADGPNTPFTPTTPGMPLTPGSPYTPEFMCRDVAGKQRLRGRGMF